MVLGLALAGPGPATLALWQSQRRALSLSRSLTRTPHWSFHARHATSRSSTSTGDLPMAPGSQRGQAKHRQPRSRTDKNKERGQSKVQDTNAQEARQHPHPTRTRSNTPKRNWSASSKFIDPPTSKTSIPQSSKTLDAHSLALNPENVIYLPPPPELAETARYIADLHAAIDRFDFRQTLYAWSQLVATRTEGLLSPGDYEAASSFLVKLLARQDLGELARYHPSSFGLIRLMAIEAAAHDQWHGLQTFLLKLIGASRPTDVIDIFNAYKRRLREVLGKDAAKLTSRKREERVAARLPGEGPRVMNVICVAALTMLNTFGSSDMLPLLDVLQNVMLTASSEKQLIARHLAQSKSRIPNLVNQFHSNLSKFQLAMQCYHPVAMESRIIALTETRMVHGLNVLYDQIMVASIGPDKFIQPRDLKDWMTEYFDVIPLTAALWCRFLIAFQKIGRLDRMIRLIDIDMPARGLRPTTRILGLALLTHVWFYSKHLKTRPDLAQESMERAEAVWQRFINEGTYLTDDAVSTRISFLSMLGRTEELEDLYTVAKKGFPPEQGRLTDRAYIRHLLGKRKWDEMFQVLESSNSGRHLRIIYGTIIREIALRRDMTYDVKREVIQRTTKIMPRWVQMDERALGALLAHLARGSTDIPRTAKTIIELMIKFRRSHSSMWWHRLLIGLCQSTARSHPEDAEAALAVLTEFNSRPVLGITTTRLRHMWSHVLHYISLSTCLSTSERHERLSRALFLFEEHMPVTRGLRWTIIRASFARKDALGIAEALEQWRIVVPRMPLADYPKQWMVMIESLVAHGYPRLATEIVESAREEGNDESVSSRFWARARELGLIVNDEENSSGTGKRRSKAVEGDETGWEEDDGMVEDIGNEEMESPEEVVHAAYDGDEGDDLSLDGLYGDEDD